MYSSMTVGLSAKDAETINTGVGMASYVADYFVPGIGAAIRSVAPLITGLFVDKPCDPKDPCIYVENWDGSGTMTGYKRCCLPPMIGTGVFIGEYSPGSPRWPGTWRTVYAGDYYWLGKGGVENHTPAQVMQKYPSYLRTYNKYMYAKEHGISLMIPNKSVSHLIVPDGFNVKLFAHPAFEGPSQEFGPGEYDLHTMGWGDAAASMKVRGPFTICDFYIGKRLQERAPGWFTSAWPDVPDSETLLKLVLGDPNRKLSNSFEEPQVCHNSFWGPGWEKRLRAKTKKMSPREKKKLEMKGAQTLQQGQQQKILQQQPRQQQPQQVVLGQRAVGQSVYDMDQLALPVGNIQAITPQKEMQNLVAELSRPLPTKSHATLYRHPPEGSWRKPQRSYGLPQGLHNLTNATFQGEWSSLAVQGGSKCIIFKGMEPIVFGPGLYNLHAFGMGDKKNPTVYLTTPDIDFDLLLGNAAERIVNFSTPDYGCLINAENFENHPLVQAFDKLADQIIKLHENTPLAGHFMNTKGSTRFKMLKAIIRNRTKCGQQ